MEFLASVVVEVESVVEAEVDTVAALVFVLVVPSHLVVVSALILDSFYIDP